MNHTYEVTFTVYHDTNLRETVPGLDLVTTQVVAQTPYQAEQMVNAQYGGRARVFSTRTVN